MYRSAPAPGGPTLSLGSNEATLRCTNLEISTLLSARPHWTPALTADADISISLRSSYATRLRSSSSLTAAPTLGNTSPAQLAVLSAFPRFSIPSWVAEYTSSGVRCGSLATMS